MENDNVTPNSDLGNVNMNNNVTPNDATMPNVNTYPNNNNYFMPNVNPIPNEYKPISAWGYFGYEILFAIPLVGFILLLVFALGGTRNINLKNFARSYFCMYVIIFIIALIIIALGFSLGSFSSRV